MKAYIPTCLLLLAPAMLVAGPDPGPAPAPDLRDRVHSRVHHHGAVIGFVVPDDATKERGTSGGFPDTQPWTHTWVAPGDPPRTGTWTFYVVARPDGDHLILDGKDYPFKAGDYLILRYDHPGTVVYRKIPPGMKAAPR